MEEQPRAAAQKIVARYHASGLSGMSEGEVRFLLSEKQAHLAQVSERCTQGNGLHVNLALKCGLKGQISEIGAAFDRGLEL